ncbi:carboxymuconolactone decarboxylase family protein [Corynebacterium imitans]|uniref:carboxymuconolactone decarboxylase family protein n=1 Tax=Corynebacterium imitans TaxID=156978 RepID=UPI001EF2332F|nr:carboxymuconolactone decarboxylase family protein [Corynebacterium imitans]MCG7279069.1 carboxymuconolactone decarboxylase family protein [Corynebacterium imitans]
MTPRHVPKEIIEMFYPPMQFLRENTDPDHAHLVCVRATAVNGCPVCTAIHRRNAREHGWSEDYILKVEQWTRHAREFSETEALVLELADALTELEDTPESLSEDLWERATEAFGEEYVRALIVGAVGVNSYNRLGIAFQQDPKKVLRVTEFDLVPAEER